MRSEAYDALRRRQTEAAQQATGRVWCSHGQHHTTPVGRWIESRVRRFICTGCELRHEQKKKEEMQKKRPTPAQRSAHAAAMLGAVQGKRIKAARGGRAESHPSEYQRPVGSPDVRRAIEDRREQQEAETWNYGI